MNIVTELGAMDLEFYKSSNFKIRFISAIILFPISFFVIYSNILILAGFMLMVSFFIGYEWALITNKKEVNLTVIVGVLYSVIPCISIIYIASIDEERSLLSLVFLTVIATDTGAYLCGKIIGGPKIYPIVSPNKSWSGFFGGCVFSVIIGFSLNQSFIFVITISILAQLGDFFESFLKRKFNVKDSSNLIPGHGGIMDRFDSFVLSSCFVAFIEIMRRMN